MAYSSYWLPPAASLWAFSLSVGSFSLGLTSTNISFKLFLIELFAWYLTPSGVLTGAGAGEVGHQRHGYEAFWVGCLTAFLRKLDTLLASP